MGWVSIDDPPQFGAKVEVLSDKNEVISAVYLDGRYYIESKNQTVVSYDNPKKWRLRK